MLHVILCRGENHNIFILDIDDQNTTDVFASKGTHAAYFNLNLTTLCMDRPILGLSNT